jgi:hypothetical protein
MVLTLEDYVGFKCSTPNVSQTTMKGLGLINVNFKLCTYQILISTNGSKKSQGLTKHEVVI